MDNELQLTNNSNGSPLYLLNGTDGLLKRSTDLGIIAKFILDNFELEEVEIVSSDNEIINIQAVKDLWQVLNNLAREELCSFNEGDIFFSEWN